MQTNKTWWSARYLFPPPPLKSSIHFQLEWNKYLHLRALHQIVNKYLARHTKHKQQRSEWVFLFVLNSKFAFFAFEIAAKNDFENLLWLWPLKNRRYDHRHSTSGKWKIKLYITVKNKSVWQMHKSFGNFLLDKLVFVFSRFTLHNNYCCHSDSARWQRKHDYVNFSYFCRYF